MKPKTVVVIPAYMEEKTIGAVVSKAKEFVDHVVVIDDGSSDATAKNAQAAGATVIPHTTNKGYGFTIKNCFNVARNLDADIAITLDADGQHYPEEIPLLIEKMVQDKLDIVIGSRFSKTQSKIPGYRKLGMKVLNTTTGLFSKQDFDSQSGFRAYSKKALTSLDTFENGMGVSSEILITARKLGLRIGEVPIRVRYDIGKPSQHPVKQGFSVLMSITRLICEEHPFTFFGLTGGILFIGSMITGWYVMDTFNRIHTVYIGSAIITAILAIIGMILMTTAVTLHTMQRLIIRSLRDHDNHKKIMELTATQINRKRAKDMP